MPFGLYNLASKFNLPDFGISEKLSGYTTRQGMQFPVGAGLNTSQQSAAGSAVRGLNYNVAPNQSTPYGSQINYPSGGYQQLSRSSQPSYSQPAQPIAPKYTSGGGVTGGGTNTAPQGTQGVQSLSGDLSSALQRANSEGRFEGMSDYQRAQAQLQYEGEKSQNRQAIDDIYGPAISAYNDLLNQYQDKRGGLEGYYQGQFAPRYTELDNSRSQLLSQNAEQITGTRQQEQGLMNEARRRAGELRQRNQQALGGSGVGQAADTILSQEQLRGQNQISNTAATDVRALERQATEYENQYVQLKQNLDSEYQSLLQQAKDNYDNIIAQVRTNRAQTESQKANANYEALQQLNNDAKQIEQQYQQLGQQLATNALSAIQQLYAQQQDYAMQQGHAPDIYNLPGAEYSQYLPTYTNNEGQPITPNIYQRRKEEELA